ncbi:Sphingoid long-chain base transporter HuRSB1 [Hanseniaspora uvarum DSM 2768]|nr:hypothetical protein FOG48_01343 [Hanseniaspora uvarum]KAF0275261.1 hypothetical protein FOG50_03989 [Hanseniaspora uvarum]KKA03888.1 Sphingoid long-chain base transporter HuRSB1 [Hanseniaspora uvarum DSM 2768]
MTGSYFNQTAAAIAAVAAGNNLTAIAEIYKGHENLSPESMYSGAQPNLVFNIIAMAVFFAFTAWQLILYVIYNNNFFGICMVLYLVGQAIGYLGRVLSAADISGLSLNNQNYFLLQFISLTISPNFFNAAVYSQYGKLLFTYATTRDNVAKLNVFGKRVQPMLLSFLFIVSDITCLVIQGIGGGVEGSNVNDNNAAGLLTGNRIFIAGLALQTASMSFFLIIYLKLLYNIFIRQRIEYLNSQKDVSNQKKISYNYTFFAPWKWSTIYKSVRFEDIDPIMYNVDTSGFTKTHKKLFSTYPVALFVAFGLAAIRCIYRLVELADNGFNGFLIKHEHYLVSLDFVPLSLSALIMCFYAEGIVFGKRGLFEIFLIKMSSYRGLGSWSELMVEFRYMFHMKVDNEKLNKQFNDLVKEQVEREDIGMVADKASNFDNSSKRSNVDSALDISSNHYLKKSVYFENSLNQEIKSPWWKFSSFSKKTERTELQKFEEERQGDYESSLRNSMEIESL